MVASEAEPLVKVGGLADVMGGLPASLVRREHEVTVALPFYGLLRKTLRGRARKIALAEDRLLNELGGEVTFYSAPRIEGVRYVLIRSDRWFGACQKSEEVYLSDPTAYIVFARAAALLGTGVVAGPMPDVVHAHDWHAGLTAPFVRLLSGETARPALVHTIHNIAYSGVFGSEIMGIARLPREWFVFDKLEFYGGFCFLKAGMVFSDVVNTVSETYAREVETPEYGAGLEGVVAHLRRQSRFFGVVNGLDTRRFDPAVDPSLPANYDACDWSGKAECKRVLQADLGLEREPDTPVIGMVARICHQKGQDLVAEAADDLVRLGCQLAILGTGDPAIITQLRAAESRWPGRISVRIGFDAYLANRIYGGADMFLMPSRFEPCGLGQLIAMRYGTPPVVRKTGGLAETVRDADDYPDAGNGFVFADASPEAIVEGVTRAVAAYHDRERWSRLIARCMAEDHGWDRSAGLYEELYLRAMQYRDREIAGV